MSNEIQKAGIWKRIAAWLFDMILVRVLAVGCGVLLSLLLGYDGYSQTVDQAYAAYEGQYGIKFEITQAEYEALSPEQRQNYDAAYGALIADDGAMKAYNMMLSLSLVITSFGILLAVLIWEFLLPLWLGNGQTLGKKIFGLCLIRQDGVKVNNLQLFARMLAGQTVCLIVTRNNAALHDLLAGTVVVDMVSQTIFRTTEDLIAHKKSVAAERAARERY